MHILLCNERFLFRFGVDRVLILYGRHLSERGHTISIIANHLDQDVLGDFVSNIHKAPTQSPYIDLDGFTARWLHDNWEVLFPADTAPDAVIIAGWPFISSIDVFKAKGVRVIFNDYGVVPLDNYDGGHRAVLERLISLRREFMPHCDAVVAISDFIADSQSRFDAQDRGQVSTIMLGADHMQAGVWTSKNVTKSVSQNKLDAILSSSPSERKKHIGINLGRWEPGCYKNSESVFKFIDNVRTLGKECIVLILADEKVEIPVEYRGSVVPVGFPDDADLQQMMEVADFGISVSLWEGFNLPLAEMQWLRKPTLCFDVGAHPEVVAHPWFLCVSEEEMARKAAVLFEADSRPIDHNVALDEFSKRFTWSQTVDQLEALLLALTYSLPAIVVDVSNATRDPANSGVIRVTRRVCENLQRHCSPIFVVWDSSLESYVYPTASEYEQLAKFNGPVQQSYHIVSQGGGRVIFNVADLASEHRWLFFPETIMEDEGMKIRRFADTHQLKTCAIFYDAIPLLRPDFVKDARIRDNHASYMIGLSECDLVIPISQYSADCLQAFWKDNGIAGGIVKTAALPGEFAGVDRSDELIGNNKDTISILCVSTLEPRKNHIRLLQAIEQFGARRPDIKWKFVMIGNRYAGGEDIAGAVQNVARKDARIEWKGVVDDDTLAKAYDSCDFTIYGSEIEGFGMPILESLWNSKPCICHSGGVMAELAAEGGCLLADMRDAEAISFAIEKLASDLDLRNRLSREAASRKIRNWEDYVGELLLALIRQPEANVTLSNRDEQPDMKQTGDDSSGWASILYDRCLTAEWQMNDSERLGLMAVLGRLKPTCAIEIGTYRGGSLSLISQFVECVYSIDIDPGIPEKFSDIQNARFFTGQSDVVLPVLLDKLTNAGIPVEFVLIDGDHSADGVKRDIEILLKYRPLKPMVVMMHDGFNPECRRGMKEANWKSSPYVHFVDLDFVPGRIVETGGGGSGEMWGGLAFAYFSPMCREGEVHFAATSQKAFDRALAASRVVADQLN